MNPVGKKWLTIGIIVVGCGVLGTVAGVYALNKLEGDEKVLSDIDRHFAAFQQTGDAPPTKAAVGFSSATPSTGATTRTAAQGGPAKERSEQKQRRVKRTGKRKKGTTRKPVPAETWPGVRQVGPVSYEIEKDLAAKARKTPMQFIPGVKAVLAEQNGAPAGFRLVGIRSGSPLFALGLRNGDLLVAVNGFALKTIDEALLAAGAAKVANKFRVDLLRSGRRLSLYYRVSST